MSVRIWIIAGLVGVPVLGLDRFAPSPLAAVDQSADVLQQARAALGGDGTLSSVNALSLEGPFRREMGPRQMEGTVVLTLALPDRMHRSEEMSLPGGASVERISVLAGDAAWDDVQNRGGMGGGMIMTQFRGPGGQQMDPHAMEQARVRRMKAELQRWRLALFAAADEPLTHAGVAESPDGKADVFEIKDDRGQPLRLFIDQRTHLPLMLSFQEVRPRMMMRGAPGGPGGRGQGGPGAPGAGGQRPDPEEIRRRIEAEGPPKPSAINLYLGEYQSVDGIMLPHRITQSVDGKPSEEWTIEKVKVNPAVKAEMFEKKEK
jgi:hypothetical protein